MWARLFLQASHTNGAKHMVIGGVVGGVVGGVAGAVIGGAATHGAGIALSTSPGFAVPLADEETSYHFTAAAGGAALGAAVGAGTGKLIAMDQNRVVGTLSLFNHLGGHIPSLALIASQRERYRG